MTTNPVHDLSAFLVRYQASPLSFVREVLEADPTPQQVELLEAVSKPGAHVSVRSGHGTGKSTSLAWLILWFVSCFPDCKVPCTAPTAHQLKDVLWAETHKWVGKMHEWWRNQLVLGQETIAVKDAEKSQFAVARTARPENPDALQGMHATHLLFVVDEASGVHERVYEVAEGALSTKGARVVLAGNPTQTTGYFHRSHHADRAHWTRLHFSCLDSPLVDSVYPEKMEAKYGADSDIYKVRVLGDFPAASVAQLIPVDLAQAAYDRKLHISEYSFAPKIFGLDIARYGDDSSALYMRQGLAVFKLGEWRNMDTMTLADQVAGLEDQHKPDAIFADVGAMGAGVIDRLRQLGREVVEVGFGNKPGDPRYTNKRSEMWGNVKSWLESGGSIYGLEDLRDDLVGPEYYFDPSGRMGLEKKEDMKKRGLASPDHGDALALTFAANVSTVDRETQRLMSQPAVADSAYDIWSR